MKKTVLAKVFAAYNEMGLTNGFIDWLNNNEESLREEERQNLIDAYCSGCKNPMLHDSHEAKAEQYLANTFEQ